MPTTLNRRERKAAQLLAHYQTCEKLAKALGMPASKADGKKISVALFKLEREAHKATEHACSYPEPYYSNLFEKEYVFAQTESEMMFYTERVNREVERIFGKLPPGFFINGDARGYTLKIDNDTPEGAALIAACGLHTDRGGYGILSPTIDGD